MVGECLQDLLWFQNAFATLFVHTRAPLMDLDASTPNQNWMFALTNHGGDVPKPPLCCVNGLYGGPVLCFRLDSKCIWDQLVFHSVCVCSFLHVLQGYCLGRFKFTCQHATCHVLVKKCLRKVIWIILDVVEPKGSVHLTQPVVLYFVLFCLFCVVPWKRTFPIKINNCQFLVELGCCWCYFTWRMMFGDGLVVHRMAIIQSPRTSFQKP